MFIFLLKEKWYPYFFVLARIWAKSALFGTGFYYKIEREMLFEPPEYNKKTLFHVYNSNLSLINKLEKGIELTNNEYRDLENLPSTFMICYLNGFEEAKQKLIDSKLILKPYSDIYLSFKEALRILRKMKYDVV